LTYAHLHILRVLDADPHQVFTQWPSEQLGHHRDAVFASLAFAHECLSAGNVDVLDA